MRKVYFLAVALLIRRELRAQTPALENDTYNFQTNGSITNAATYTAVGNAVF